MDANKIRETLHSIIHSCNNIIQKPPFCFLLKLTVGSFKATCIVSLTCPNILHYLMAMSQTKINEQNITYRPFKNKDRPKGRTLYRNAPKKLTDYQECRFKVKVEG